MTGQNSLVTIFLVFFCSQHINFSEGTSKTAACPAAKSLAPCECLIQPDLVGLTVKCEGLNITQANIDHALKAIEKLPNLHTFAIIFTDLSELNLKSLSGHTMHNLNITENHHLHSLIGSSTLNGKIKVKALNIEGNGLTDYGLRDALVKFDPALLTRLSLLHNHIVGSQVRIGDKGVNAAFLPGLFTLKNLEYLGLEFNGITNIAGGQFRKNTMLKALHLDLNHLEEIGEDAFLFDEDPKSKKEKLTIGLSHNMLRDEKISAKSGLERLHRPTSLEMGGHHFTHISKEKFHKFLMNNKLNEIQFGDIYRPILWGPIHHFDDFENDTMSEPGVTELPADKNEAHDTAAAHDIDFMHDHMYFSYFICDGRMQWLKKEKAHFMNRVHNVTCSNDMPNTIFNTTLI